MSAFKVGRYVQEQWLVLSKTGVNYSEKISIKLQLLKLSV